MDDYNKLITDNFKNEINRMVIQVSFPSLNIRHQALLLTYLLDIIEVIIIKFGFMKDPSILEQQLRQNNYRDTQGLLLMLLPFIKDDELNTNKRRLSDLNNLYIEKTEESIKDINKGQPNYRYSNLQYGRCKRNNGIASEINFEEEHLLHNLILLKDTIQRVSNKLYINWIDIRPLKDFSILQKKTQDILDQNLLNYWEPTDNEKNAYKKYYDGLFVGDIYNTIANNFYENIKNIKWMIYDVTISQETFQIFFPLLGEIFDLTELINDIPWNRLTTENRDKFKSDWSDFMNSVFDNRPYKSKNNNALKYVLEKMLIFFDKYYTLKNEAIAERNYIPLPQEKEEEGDEKLDQDKEEEMIIKDSDLKVTAKSLQAQDIYQFIFFAITKFKKTYYAGQVIEKNPNNKWYFSDTSIRSKENLSLKNIYNFSKSLTHYITNINGKNRYLPYPRQWNSLEKKDKDEILKRLNADGDVTSWFNIGRYLKFIRGITGQEAIEMNNSIYLVIKQRLIAVVLGEMERSGVLSIFIPDRRITDRTNYNTNQDIMEREVKNNLAKLIIQNSELRKTWDNSNYFLTGDNYKNLTVDGKPYLDFLVDENSYMWYITYAMDWVSQINFFHHYLNNRIIYVTGATGVGKSTQIPKLSLYALKMIDYKMDGKIVCTQPRIPPTESTARQVSIQMGVPIEEKNDLLKKTISTGNTIIQYKHKMKSHLSDRQPYFLRVVTDGTLYQSLKSNPLLKKRLYNSKIGKTSMAEKNLFDIVMVDEAHEHNKNMDLILTIMKYSTYYNNNIKLIILSATLEEDEPIYRRYYRDINDNRMLPFDLFIVEKTIDRINVDRRMHISPPGETTRYPILDIFDPDTDGIELILKVANSRRGHILFFQPGVKLIRESVEKLNKVLPPNVIALAYYSEMSGEKKRFIETLDEEKVRRLTIPRNIPFDTSQEDLSISKVAPGTYNKVVIVATNIAEASITINSLGTVIDTGKQKLEVYDYKMRAGNLITTAISESSRLQRRGRVGRRSPGTVYYLYKKSAMVFNKIQYNISISDISENLLDLLRNDCNEKKQFDETLNPNIENSALMNLRWNIIPDFIKSHYFYKHKFFNYFGKRSHYDYQNATSTTLKSKTCLEIISDGTNWLQINGQ